MSGRMPKYSTVAFAIAALAVALVVQAPWAAAQVASDQEAGYIVFPKVVVDTAGTVYGAGRRVDTLIQLTNTDSNPPNTATGPAAAAPHRFHCFWINTNSCCGSACGSTNNVICDPNSADPCEGGLPCVQSWSEQSNFQVLLTAGQPLGFLASTGQGFVDCDAQNSNAGCTSVAEGSVSGVGSPFIGELKCVEVFQTTDEATQPEPTNPAPIARNDLKGEARIYSVTSGTGQNTVDARQYNAVGFPVPSSVTTFDDSSCAAPNDVNCKTESLCLGAPSPGPTAGCPSQEYAGCPSAVILNHFFDNATPFTSTESVRTTLTLVPCSEDILVATPAAQQNVRVQLAIFNEFEQRFSSSTQVNCYRSTPLSDLDTVPGPSDDATSIFSASVQGTLTGQTRIVGGPGNALHGLIGIAEETYTNSSNQAVFSDAFNLHYDPMGTARFDVVNIQP